MRMFLLKGHQRASPNVQERVLLLTERQSNATAHRLAVVVRL